ncbi:aldo/keto reductase family protein [Thermocaproicibacter melissae]|jgi:alcohol dehydrogenase (NADP+)|uniref:aldo/keto reductase family protein n=1 Tax=Thermocaproicibacter melissae TaxID=2966552 RepID=UPI0024B145DD|nr:aldo/keto reductase [Thermocaproicibacter melissae]WBY64179.1 aldo/keto reductase [Thermocaproicibacter melissae]
MANQVDPNTVPTFALSNGDKIPCIGMGTFGSDHVPPEEVADAVAGAIRCGYRLFDCASVYGNEPQIGKVFDAAFREGIVKREDLFIMSKVWNDQHGKGEVLLACAKTLRDLQLDYLDAYFVHWPFPNYHAPGCSGDFRSPDAKPFSVDDFMVCWRQMERLYDMGLVRNLGMSNMTIPKLNAVLPHCRIKPTLLEMELHPSFQQKELFDYAVSFRIQPVAFCPIGSPSRPERDKSPDDVVDTELPIVREIAKVHNITPALVCLKWAVQRGAIPIPFSVHEAHYVENLRCTTCDPLSDEEMAALRSADANCRLIKGQVFLWPGATDWRDLWDVNGEITNKFGT